MVVRSLLFMRLLQKGESMSSFMMISDAAKEVQVESHVLRYWEEELHLPIKRNELGHRFYTKEDVECFKQIKSMKERGLQLKAIKMILKDGRLDIIGEKQGETEPATKEEEVMPIQIVDSREAHEGALERQSMGTMDREGKARRLQWILQQMIRETIQESNEELCREIRESLVKELDYQFRTQEERDDERCRLQMERTEQYYQKMDEMIRKKNRRSLGAETREENSQEKKTEKKKRHFIF